MTSIKILALSFNFKHKRDTLNKGREKEKKDGETKNNRKYADRDEMPFQGRKHPTSILSLKITAHH